MSTFVRSNEEAILDFITGHLAALGFRVKCELGAEADARRGAPPRITWVPSRGGRRYTHPAQQRAGGKVGQEKEVLFDVHVWGDNYPAASRLEEALISVLFNHISPNGYELQDGGGPAEEPESPAPGEARGYELVIPIRLLRIPIFVEWRPTATIAEASGAGEVFGALGELPASPGPTITIG